MYLQYLDDLTLSNCRSQNIAHSPETAQAVNLKLDGFSYSCICIQFEIEKLNAVLSMFP